MTLTINAPGGALAAKIDLAVFPSGSLQFSIGSENVSAPSNVQAEAEGGDSGPGGNVTWGS